MSAAATRRIRLRELGPDDAPVLDAVFAGMSQRSRALRFHRPMPTLPPSVRQALTTVDGDRHMAVAAEVRHRRRWHPVGIGRIVTNGDQPAELAVSVVDPWQGRGLGTRIVRTLVDLARARGVHELVAEVLAENRPMLRVLQREFPTHRTERYGDTLRMICHVADAWDLTPTHDDLLRALA